MDSETLLEAKKKQLLADLEDGSIFKGKSFFEEEAEDSSNGFAESNEPETVVCGNAEDRSSKQSKTAENQRKRRQRRKGKALLKALENNQTNLNQVPRNSSSPNGGRKYSRLEMEAMRFMNIVEQMSFWETAYNGLEAEVVKEYQNLSCNLDPRFGRIQPLHGDAANVSDDGDQDDDYDYDDDDDDDHVSIQRRAFYVEGEPDFDSGPPEDGLEYLRRVRWEAARIPKVKIAKIDKDKIINEQSVYMPQIPDIPKCPDHLLPSKAWEDAFLVDFAQLRLLLARDEDDVLSNDQTSQAICVDESSEIGPTLSAVRAMDSVYRVSSLKKRIRGAEKASSLSKNECVWLFALCAAVDMPLLADTSAAIRSLFRKCASLRAGKVELDDEVVMLNVLATVCGRYFGQAEY
ncbi:Gem-associated protein 2 [Linum grandiflorum]